MSLDVQPQKGYTLQARIAALWREAYCEGATLELLRELLQLDPDQARHRQDGLTLLYLAVNHRLHEGVAILLAAGGPVNAGDHSGEIPLHRAAWNLDPEGCLQLLEGGADPTARDRHGCTPFDVAVNGDIWASHEDREVTQRILATAEARRLSCTQRPTCCEPIVFATEWRTGTALSLAQQMYDSRDFSAMPILADALQDAGCDNTDVLDHCRGPGPHVRGCWVVDLVLGKE